MRNLFKYILLTVAFPVFLLIISCKKDEVEIPDSVFYISNQIAPVNTHDVSVRFDVAKKEIESVSGNPIIKFPIRATMPLKESVIVECGVNRDYLGDYNSKNNTSIEVLPDNLYTIEKSTVTMEMGQTVSEDSIIIRINTEALPENVDSDITEALPIGILSVNNAQRQISSNMSTAMIFWNFNAVYNIVSSENKEFEGTLFNDNLTLSSDASNSKRLEVLTDGNTAGGSWYPFWPETELNIKLEKEETLKGLVIHTIPGNYQLGNVRVKLNMKGKLKEVGEFNTTSATNVLYIKFTQPVTTNFLSLDRMLTIRNYRTPDLTEINLVK